jgi:uncharacterized membrane protein YfhO
VLFRACDSGRVSHSARLQCAGFLVLTDTWRPGWRATVDGRATPIHEAYGALRGVVVPAGPHTVEFRYRPWSAYWGALSSALAFAAAALAWFRLRF